MTVELLTEQHLECLSVKGDCTGSTESISHDCHGSNHDTLLADIQSVIA